MSANTNRKTTSIANSYLTARKASLDLFGDISHRLESLVEIEGVEYINDSKATDIESSWYSLELMQKPVIWIVGGAEAENDYAVFQKLVKFKVKNIICFGADNKPVMNALEGLVESYKWVPSLEEAVNIAGEVSIRGDVVLFSPACSSFDLYADFTERGNAFKELVKKLV